MKITITWLRKNGICQSWTNGDAAEYLVMGQCVMNDAISRLAREKGMTYDEAREYIAQIVRRIASEGNYSG